MISEIPDFSRTRILVAGDVMLDRYWHGPASRISPEAPVPVVRVSDIEHRAGGAGNVALNIRALGGQASLIGLTGDDPEADILGELLADKAIDCRLIRQPDRQTITKLRVISHHQQLIRLDFEAPFDSADFPPLAARFEEQLGNADAVILSDYAKGALQDTQRLIQRCRDAGKPVLIDPKGKDFDKYRHATLLTPNLSEFEAWAGPCRDRDELARRGEQARRELALDALLITLGDQGMLLLQPDRAPWRLAADAREVYDVTGAGDTVIATLAAALAAGAELTTATRLANLAAGIVVGKLGAATASQREMQAAAQTHTPLKRGILDEASLLDSLRHARRAGERIVMTNGCFDILHPGHVAYLSQARALGDRLIVAVNDDASVKRLKGEQRPINPLMQRMAVLSGLESIDWVVPFSEDTPERLIRAIQPDILVKGGDYQKSQIAGADFVEAQGGKVVILDFIDGASTTAIIDAIRKQD